MSTKVQHRRGNNSEINNNVPATGEIWYNTDTKALHVGDGSSKGGKVSLTDESIWGDRYVGTFASGFTYTKATDIARGQDGKYYRYIGNGSYPIVVTAGTVPSVGAGYEQVTFNAASDIKFSDNKSVQDFRDELSAVDVVNLNGGSVQDFISRYNSDFSAMVLNADSKLSVGQKVSTGAGVWLINSSLGVPIQNSVGLFARPLNGVWLSDFMPTIDGSISVSTEAQAAFDAAEGFAINIDYGVFHIANGNVDVRSNTKVNGLGGVIKLGGHTSVLRVWDVENVNIDSVEIDGDQQNWTYWNQYTLPIVGSRNITVQNCHIYNGQNVGIAVGQQLKPNYNKNIKILNNHVHNIGMANHPNNISSYGSGIAVTGGEDVTIRGNTVHDIHQVACIDLEGTLLKNIIVSENICYRTTGRASGIKCYAGGVDVPADNVIIRDNTLYEIGNVGDDDAANTEPTIWIEEGNGVTVDNNTIRDCPAVGKAGTLEATSSNTSLRVTNNVIKDCDGGAIRIVGAEHLWVKDNEVHCTSTTKLLDDNRVPLYVETRSSGQGTAEVNGNLVADAPYTSMIFNPRSAGDFTGNKVVRPNRKGGLYTIKSLVGFKFSKQGGNIIVHDGDEVIGVATYNFSGGGHQDMEVLPDVWKVPDISLLTKYDVGSNNYFIESSFAIKTGSNPTPTLGYNERGRRIATTNPQAGNHFEYVCTAAGTPGTWVGTGIL